MALLRFALSRKQECGPSIDYLGLSGKSNMVLMGRIAFSLTMTANPTLGASNYAWHEIATNFPIGRYATGFPVSRKGQGP